MGIGIDKVGRNLLRFLKQNNHNKNKNQSLDISNLITGLRKERILKLLGINFTKVLYLSFFFDVTIQIIATAAPSNTAAPMVTRVTSSASMWNWLDVAGIGLRERLRTSLS